jgi:hypothetical protein
MVSTKQVYTPPHLEVYGDIKQITQGVGGSHNNIDAQNGSHTLTT